MTDTATVPAPTYADDAGETPRVRLPIFSPSTPTPRLARHVQRRLERRRAAPAHMPPPTDYTGRSVSDLARAIVRGELDAGRELRAGTALVQILEAYADPLKPGPRPVIHLGIRKRKGCKTKIVIIDGFKEKSTGREAVKGPDPTNDHVARLKLTEYREQKLLRVLFQRTWQDLLLADACEEYLNDHMPSAVRDALKAKWRAAEAGNAAAEEHGTPQAEAPPDAAQRPTDKRRSRFETVAFHCELFIECFPHLRLGDVRIDLGEIYMAWRTAQQIGSQRYLPPGTPGRRTVEETTALNEIEDLRMVLRYFYSKHGTAPLEFFLPDLENEHGVEWITGRELLRLLRACRGWKFDRFGALLLKPVVGTDGIERLVADRASPEETTDFAAVERFIFLEFFFGSRADNVLDWGWGVGRTHGGMDWRTGAVIQKGALQRRTTKRHGAAPSAQPIEVRYKLWFAEDKALGAKHIVHDPLGEPLSYSRLLRLFKQVAKNAGVEFARPHMLKHSAVTLFSHAGMSLDQLAIRFSTTRETLENTYWHLRECWASPPRTFKPENLELIPLVRNSPVRPPAAMVRDAA